MIEKQPFSNHFITSTDAFGPTRTPGRYSQNMSTTNNYETRQSESYELENRYASQNVVSPAAQTDISTMDGYLGEVRDSLLGVALQVFLNMCLFIVLGG